MRILSEIKIIYIPILFFPVALVTGPFLPDLILSLMSLIFILHLYKKKNLLYLYNDFSKIFFLFYLYLVITSLLSDEVFYSLKNTFFYFRFLIFALVLKYLIIESKNFRKIFPLILLFVLIVLSFDAIIEYLKNSHWLFDKSEYPENDNNRISGLFDEEYILGGFILSLFPTFLIIYYNQNKEKKLITYFLIFLFCFTIIITGERSSLVKLLLFIFFVTFFSTLLSTFKKKIIFFIILLLGIFSIIFSQPKLKERIIYHTFDLLLQKKHETKIDRNLSITENLKKELKKSTFKLVYFSKEHSDHAIISIEMFKDKFLFGHGVKMFRFKCSEEKYYINDRSCSTHSHGVLLSFISELGFIGLLFIILIYLQIFKNIFKNKKKTIINSIILISIFVYLFPFLPSGYFFNNFFSMILYTLVGTYFGYKKIR